MYIMLIIELKSHQLTSKINCIFIVHFYITFVVFFMLDFGCRKLYTVRMEFRPEGVIFIAGIW